MKTRNLALILTQDAIANKSFFPYERKINTGEYETPGKSSVPLSTAKHIISGTARISGQEHFYLETNASLVVPGREDDEIEIYASTQNATETQVSKTLNDFRRSTLIFI